MKKVFVALLLASAGSSAHASEYGCKVLLCLADPRGPRTEAECRPPIDKLFRDLAKGRSFPTCDLADGNDGSSYARQLYDPYDPCPVPLQPAGRNTFVVQGERRDGGNSGIFGGSSRYALQGRPQISEPPHDMHRFGPRACVGNSVGSYQVRTENDSYYQVFVYDTIEWQQPQSPRAIDVYIDHKWHRRVHW